MKRILLIMAAALVAAGAGSRAAAPTQTVLPVTFKGKYVASAGEVITAAGPLSDVSIRVSVPDVVIHDVNFLNATRDVARPATIDGSGSTNLVIQNVEIRGDGTQQAQAIYVAGGSGLHVIGGECVDPGNDRYFDHCLYLNNTKDFLIEGYTAKAAHGAALHLYSGGSTGRVVDSDFGRAAWNVVAWGAGNDVTVSGSRLHDAYRVESGRGYAVEAASGGKVTLSNSHVWGAESAGNVTGAPGVNQNGGTFVDAGGNVFAPPSAGGQPSPPPPPVEEPVPPLPPVEEPVPPPPPVEEPVPPPPVQDATPPSAPEGVAAAARNSGVRLDWIDNGEPDLGGYAVYRRSADGSWPDAPLAAPPAASFIDTALDNGTEYAYRVTARDTAGNESAPSAVVSATPVQPSVARTYQPEGYTIVSGAVRYDRGALSRLFAADRSRVEISARRSGGSYVSEIRVSATIAAAELATLRSLTITEDGSASSGAAVLTLSIYDWRAGSWAVLDGPRTGVTWDRTAIVSPPGAVADYVSPVGEVLVAVKGTRSSSFTLRTDLVWFTIQS